MTMRAHALRYRMLVVVFLYLVGFLAPWQWLSHRTEVTLWLTGSTLLARAGWLGLASATRVVTLIALSCLGVGAVLCLVGAAVAASAKGRRSIYLGMWLQALGASVLMPLSGSGFFLISNSLLTALLLSGTRHLSVPGASDASLQPQWAQAFIREMFPLSFAICFAVFAWRYNAHVLIQCLLICFGISLVARAILPSKTVSPR